jgi:hypothetical protein
MSKGKPEVGKVYALTGGSNTPSIMNGNTWSESEVKENTSNENYGSKESHNNFEKMNSVMCDYLNNHIEQYHEFTSSNIPMKYIKYFRRHNGFVKNGPLHRGRMWKIVIDKVKKTFSIKDRPRYITKRMW